MGRPVLLGGVYPAGRMVVDPVGEVGPQKWPQTRSWCTTTRARWAKRSRTVRDLCKCSAFPPAPCACGRCDYGTDFTSAVKTVRSGKGNFIVTDSWILTALYEGQRTFYAVGTR